MLKKPDEDLVKPLYLVSGISQVKSTNLYGFLSLNHNTTFFSLCFFYLWFMYMKWEILLCRKMNSIIKYLTSFYYNITCQKTLFLFRRQCFSRKRANLEKIVKQNRMSCIKWIHILNKRSYSTENCKTKSNVLCEMNIHLFQSRLSKHHAVT